MNAMRWADGLAPVFLTWATLLGGSAWADEAVAMRPEFREELSAMEGALDVYWGDGVDWATLAESVWGAFVESGVVPPPPGWQEDPTGRYPEWVHGAARSIIHQAAAERRSPGFWAWMWGCVEGSG